jgi:hypothetical protein
MKTEFKGICSRFNAKTSQTGNLYYQVDLTETIETGNPDEPKIDRTFKDLYLNIGKPIEDHHNFIGRSVRADISIYPLERKVGEKIYTDIKLKLEHIEIL